ncbi:hypothetical protein Y032_0001g152 [Ancylostoma ceylanicum]|uniref:Uncharacterized protein n=1 Tax=Ancylostoma ceylanicum TaxID=53326 RepID=A0A016W2M9_9BILA|nr:hypothetical protein Y032_0001g152 [Ancylostoma ceylanicum]
MRCGDNKGFFSRARQSIRSFSLANGLPLAQLLWKPFEFWRQIGLCTDVIEERINGLFANGEQSVISQFYRYIESRIME